MEKAQNTNHQTTAGGSSATKKAVAKAKEYGMMSLVILNEHGERERLVFRN